MGLTVKVKGWLGSLRERRGATILRALALSAGAFLVVTGVIGLSAIAFGELVYFVGSIYTIIFGLTALVVEVKHKLALIRHQESLHLALKEKFVSSGLN